MLATPTADRTFYATNPYDSAARSIIVSTRVTDPNDGNLDFGQIAAVTCTFTSTATETTPADLNLYTYNSGQEGTFNSFFNVDTADEGKFEFTIDTDSWPNTGGTAHDGGNILNLSGDIYAKVTVEDDKGKTKNKSVMIARDDTPPVLSNYSFTGGVSNYVKREDVLNLSFTASDGVGSGVTGVDTIIINSVNNTASAVNVNVTASAVKTNDNINVSYIVLPMQHPMQSATQ